MSSTEADESSKPGRSPPHRVSRRTPVVTSRGAYFVRAVSLKDVLDLTRREGDAAANAADMGRAVIQRRTFKADAREDETLSDDEFAALSEADLHLLADDMLRAGSQEPADDGDAIRAVGQYVLDQRRNMSERAARPPVAGPAWTLDAPLDNPLDDPFDAHAAAVDAARRDMQRHLEGIRTASNALHSIGKTLHEHVEAIRRKGQADRQAQAQAVDAEGPGAQELPPAGAAGDAGTPMREVAGTMAVLAAHMGQLSATVASQLVPSWMEQIQQERHAIARSLWWAKAAVGVSIAVALWQGWLLRGHLVESQRQQQAVQTLVAEQAQVIALMRRQIEEEEARKREAAGGRKATPARKPVAQK
jgi:hypothetical protein